MVSAYERHETFINNTVTAEEDLCGSVSLENLLEQHSSVQQSVSLQLIIIR